MDSKIVRLAITEDEVSYITNLSKATAPSVTISDQNRAIVEIAYLSIKDPDLIRKLAEKLEDAYYNG